ncbi:DUF2304 domain-containing protein [Candidatus Woesearchaeota archaeon]|nr:DUF2304 domain-containing protein [Candidatus Woesearchaeota archaeon]
MASEILGIQLLGILVGLGFLYITFLNFKRRELTVREFSFWISLWIAFTILSIIPQILDPIIRSLNLSRRLDFFIIIGFMFLIWAVFYTYLIVRKSQKRIEEIVRKLALKEEKE